MSDILSLENASCIKGIFSVFVVVCHLQGYARLFNDGFIAYGLHSLGYLSVAVFFFLSGYGLITQTSKKQSDYIARFPQKRLLPFYCNCLLLIAIHILFYMFVDATKITPSLLLQSLTFGETIIINGWYLQTVLIFYIGFYIAFRFIKDRNKAILTASGFLLLYIFVCIWGETATTKYESVLAIVLGMIWANKKVKLEKKLFDHYWLSTAFWTVAFVGTFLLSYYLKIFLLKTVFKMLSAIAFCVVVILIIKKIPINNPVTRMLGKYSFEIYVLQGLCMVFWHSKLVYIDNKYLYLLLTVATLAVLSVLLHPLFGLPAKLIRGTSKDLKCKKE